MGFLTDFVRGVTMARDQLDSEVYAVVFELAESHGWDQDRAHEFCMKDKFNYKRIVHMKKMLGQSVSEIATAIHNGAVASNFRTR